MIPLSTRMRPQDLDGFVGQKHFFYKGSLLYNAVVNGTFDSAIFFGPSGTGKTTLARIIAGMLDALADTSVYGIVLRAKGMVPRADGTWLYFDMVPGEHELRDGSPEVTGKLCVIGSKLDPEKLNELFHAQGRLSED